MNLPKRVRLVEVDGVTDSVELWGEPNGVEERAP